ncbi:long-chain fatty acid--CoA ligase [Cryobacterium sp. TMT1-21]|uniref:Long-chain fatty acid--CoA ligase n=1 Tax=Cryobacterium shii TaxID=1259235 RepID=A0AAQ2HGV2_9MICO|nr:MULTISPECIES: long-chain-fatty-acid--CoA ligase [Cryobacterium]TFC52224.1 long-chain fatty acid--CoA ligase [Cryobacterium shii]TFC88473.1 long-chain fatty acid--CoA ligase [Cryobacterium sp. TmT2-59]TFD11935.1 long-chain fatty acid--CoA ligase [Cryobacterium sp. TMT1-21]TFD18949.1 long-chain fatty acid--CoA ligase [Cryobacterium sp. TMT2-23]TFD20981.1 long-chain fatty acid--CoA ligase [Cryobacterium sp. TMT4-10]
MSNIEQQSWVKNYQPGVPAEIDLPEESLVAMLERSVAEAGSHPALEFFGRRTSYTELGDQIDRAAEGLRGLGVRAEDRVALLLPNCPQHVVAFYAVLRLGAVVVEHNPLYTARELRHQFEDHQARIVIAWDKSVASIRTFPADIEIDHIVSVNLLEAFPAIKRLALHLPVKSLRESREALTGPAPKTIPWKDLLSHGPIDPEHPRPAVTDLAAIQYTSGTTGQPKGAMLTHFNLYSNALQGEAWMQGAEYRKEIFYAILPMFHAFGMTLYLTYGIRKQALLVLFPKFDPNLILDAMKKSPATVYCAVPPIYERTAVVAKERGISLRSCKYCISGAMNLPDHVVELWESVSGGLLVEGYGMTESSPVALGNPFHPTRRTGTIGVPFPSTRMKVVDLDDPTREVPQGEPGELLLNGPQVFQGYWNNPEETAKTLLPGGWLRTGDIVTVDEDGFTTIVDRAKELVITGGFNVSPSEVEAVLRLHADVVDAAVFGKALERGGELVVAAVELKPGARLDEEALRAHCREHLAAYKIPRRIVQIQDMPRSMLGKILRKQVREQVLPQL